MKHTLAVLVEDEAGVLSRISGLFARRGFNIESLAVGHSAVTGISRITLVVIGDQRTIEQITKQLYKLINVLKVQDITNLPLVERELILIKVKNVAEHRADILQVCNIFRARIVSVTQKFLIIEITGDPQKANAIEKLLSRFGIIEIARTGKIALVRE